MESVRSILSLQQSTSESELLELLRALTVPKLKLLCKENATKTSGNKADIIGRLVTRGRQRATFLQRHACVQGSSFVDEGPIAADTLHLHAAVPLFGQQQGEDVR